MLFKKTISILTAVLVVICCLPLTASAFDDGVKMTGSFSPEYRLSDSDLSETEKKLSIYTDVSGLKELFLEAVSGARVVTDISEYNFPTSVHSEITAFIFYAMPEAFNVYEVAYSYSGSTLLSIHLGFREFADTPEEYSVCFDKMKKSADDILSGIENNSALSDEYKALLLHDRLCVYNEYPFYMDITDIEHTAYGALANGSSVCQGYAMAYMYLLNRVGIKNYYVSSGKLNHAWNIVYIDGKPYHVDVTFDDINWEKEDLRNVSGALHHKNFLVSTNTLRNREHNAYDFDSTPADTKYDNYYWGNSDTEFQLVGNKIYYIDNRSAELRCLGNDTPLISVSDMWTAGGYSYWAGNYSRLSSAGGELFCSVSDSIYKYTAETGECEKIYTPYLHEGFSIYGFTYKDGNLIYEVNTAPAGGEYTYLKRETAPYSNISHILQYIEVKGEDVYYLGDSFNTDKTTVTAYYTDNTSEVLVDGVSFSGFDSTSAGEKTVTASYKDFKADFTVTVKVPAVTFPESISINEDETVSLSASTDPAGQNITWRSSSSDITAADGKITGVKRGTADVTAEFTYNGKVYSAVCRVTVNCIHKNTAVHKEIPPTVSNVGYTEGVFCNGCEKYISGHEEIPKLDLTFAPSDYMVSDGVNVRIIVGKLITELFWSAPAGCTVYDKNGKTVGDRDFAATGMVLILPDGSKQEIVVIGDADGDAQISASDARTALRAAVGLESFSSASAYFKASDVDKDNAVTANDARFILRASVGLEDNTLWL